MTITDTSPVAGMDQTPPKHHPHRWRMNRLGIVDVWYYYDTEFDLSGGRLVLRGTNGSGKSRALELLLPFLLDADRRKSFVIAENVNGVVVTEVQPNSPAAERRVEEGEVIVEVGQ